MDRRFALASFRLGSAAVTAIAIVYQFLQLAAAGTLVPVNFLSYFTIQSNLIAVAVFLVGAARRNTRADPRLGTRPRRRGRLHDRHPRRVRALLSGTDVDTATPWVNTSSTSSCRSP